MSNNLHMISLKAGKNWVCSSNLRITLKHKALHEGGWQKTNKQQKTKGERKKTDPAFNYTGHTQDLKGRKKPNVLILPLYNTEHTQDLESRKDLDSNLHITLNTQNLEGQNFCDILPRSLYCTVLGSVKWTHNCSTLGLLFFHLILGPWRWALHLKTKSGVGGWGRLLPNQGWNV